MPTRDEPWPDGTPCWVGCQVDDVAAACAFYGGLFGWEIHDGPEEAEGYVMALKDGRPAAGIGPTPEGQDAPAAWTTYFASGDLDAAAADVADGGGTVFVAPFDVLDLGRMAVAADPSGAAFALWQARGHRGAGVVGEHGTLCWSELHTRDYAAAQEFYATVFGWTYREIGDGENLVSAVAANGEGDVVGGVCDDAVIGVPAQVPAHWLTWFAVDDADAAADAAARLGGTVSVEPRDSPFGRMVVAQGTGGELFGIIDPSAAAAGGA